MLASRVDFLPEHPGPLRSVAALGPVPLQEPGSDVDDLQSPFEGLQTAGAPGPVPSQAAKTLRADLQ